jgi:Bacterial SH3 domain
LILVVTWMCVTGVAIAAPVRMNGDDIQRAMMPGALLEIDTPLHISIPVKVSTNHIISANSGALGLTLGAQKDRGRWWADGDKLCMKWFRWFDAKPRCMVLLRQGNRVYWHEGSGESGTATLTEANPIVAVVDMQQSATTSAQTARRVTTEAIPVPASHKRDAIPEPTVRFASEAFNEVIAAIKPIEHSQVSMLGGPVPTDEPQSEPATAPSSPSLVKQSKEPPAVGSPSLPARPREIFHVTGVRIDDELTLRSGPSEYHSAVGSVAAAGRNIEIIGECRGGWCPVRHGTDVGWVNRRYLVVERETHEASENPD